MKRLLIILLPAALLLSGCWDELIFKDTQMVTMVGIEGDSEEVTVNYGFPAVTDSSLEISTIEAKGRTYGEARNDANERSSEVLDLSFMQILFLTEDAARYRVYDFLDNFFRIPRNRVTAHVMLTQGELKDYFAISGDYSKFLNSSESYSKMINTFHQYSLSTMYDLQQVCTILFDEGMDLSLPVIRINQESGKPELAGTGLFKGMEYTGEMLTVDEGRLLTMLKGEEGSILRMSYEVDVDGEKVPILLELVDNKQKINIDGEQAGIDLQIVVEAEEFAHGPVYKGEKQFNELEDQLGKLIEEDIDRLIGRLQEAGSDAIGIGRRVRAFHEDIWKKGNWNDTFVDMEIDASVKLTMERSGILE